MVGSPVHLQISEHDTALRRTLFEQLSPYGAISVPDVIDRNNVPIGRAFILEPSDSLDPLAMKCRIRTGAAPIIFYESNPSAARHIEARHAGALAVIGRPLDILELLPLLWPLTEEAMSHEDAVRFEIACRHRILRLSGRQRDVLQCLIEGCSNKDAAEKLLISPRTVEIHRADLMKRTGAGSLADLIKLAIVSGLYEQSLTTWRKTYRLSAA